MHFLKMFFFSQTTDSALAGFRIVNLVQPYIKTLYDLYQCYATLEWIYKLISIAVYRYCSSQCVKLLECTLNVSCAYMKCV